MGNPICSLLNSCNNCSQNRRVKTIFETALRSLVKIVLREDIRRVVLPALRHRIILNFEGEAERVDPDGILQAIIETTRD